MSTRRPGGDGGNFVLPALHGDKALVRQAVLVSDHDERKARERMELDADLETPAAILGLVNRIRDYGIGGFFARSGEASELGEEEARVELNKFLSKKRFMIEAGLKRFVEVPVDFIKKHGAARIQGDPTHVSEDAIRSLKLDNYQVSPGADNHYSWEIALSALEMVGKYGK